MLHKLINPFVIPRFYALYNGEYGKYYEGMMIKLTFH